MTQRQTRNRAIPRHDGYALGGHNAPPSAFELDARRYARWDAAPLALTPIEIDCDPRTPAWMHASIEEADGRLGTARAWRWSSGTGHAGTILHFAAGSLGSREYVVGIQCDDAAPAWSESPFAPCVEGITAALAQHVCENPSLTLA